MHTGILWAVQISLHWRAWCCNELTAWHIEPAVACCRRTGLLMLSRLASTAVTVRLHKQIFFESEATSMATFLWKVRCMLGCHGTVAR